jgi:hypothetical protein
MGLLLAFMPFIAFAVVERLIGPMEGLFAGALASAALLAHDRLIRRRAPKLLEVGSFLLFAGLAGFALVQGSSWSVIAVRLWVDGGLLLIVLASLLLGRPFTLQYAREQVAPEIWGSRQFIRVNTVITAAWAVAFLVMVVAEFALLYVPEFPHRIGVIGIILALVGAFKFTAWYPGYAGRRETP